jgi:hypothetical protein
MNDGVVIGQENAAFQMQIHTDLTVRTWATATYKGRFYSRPSKKRPSKI